MWLHCASQSASEGPVGHIRSPGEFHEPPRTAKNRQEPPRTAPNRPESPRSDEQKRLRGTDQTATVHLEYISDLIEPAFVENDLKRGKVRLIFTRCEDAANRYDFNSKFNDNVKTL